MVLLTDGQTDGRTDKVNYRVASLLKNNQNLSLFGEKAGIVLYILYSRQLSADINIIRSIPVISSAMG